MTERLTFVDQNDNPIGVGPREEAWANGYYTRNVRMVLRDQNGRILSQKRSKDKSAWPGMWTVAAGGHVDEGEEWEVAAIRELKEEIGVATDLKFVGSFKFVEDSPGKKTRQIVRVYEGTVDGSTQFTLQESEVEKVEWFDLDELKSLMQETPDQFTPAFHETIAKFY